MSMSPKLQAEYDAALLAATLKHGTPLGGGGWGWQDFDALRHLGRMIDPTADCWLVATADLKAIEDEWTEPKGTFDESDRTRHGVIVYRVSCACGLLTNRDIRWDAGIQEIAEAVFEEAFSAREER